nr:hypothetical protein [Candidatus Freyarchaeota archaeon]
MDYSDLDAHVENMRLRIDLGEKGLTPQPYDKERLALGGCKFNVTSTVDRDATPEDVIRGWSSLNEIIPMEKLFIPLFHQNFVNYRLTGVMSAEPTWTKLLRLCYWYQKCLDIPDSDFHYKQNEFKRKINKPLRYVEESIEKKSPDFITKVGGLSEIIMSHTSELLFAASSHSLGYKVTFDKKHDFRINYMPAEVKTLYSHFKIDWQNEIPKIVIGGEPKGEFNLRSEIQDFIYSKKVLDDVNVAVTQGGLLIFLDASQTFAGLLLNYFPIQKSIDLPLSDAIKDAVNIAGKNNESKIPVIIYSSINFDVYTTSALMIPVKRL